MKLRIQGFILLTGLIISNSNVAQTQVVLEQIQSYSTVLPNASYWKLDQKNALQLRDALERGLFKSMSLNVVKNYPINIVALNKSNQLGKIQINWEQSSTIPLHAYIELYELDPSFAYKNNLLDIPESKKDSIKSVWFITCSIINQEKQVAFKKTVLMSLMPQTTIGIGYPTVYPLSAPSNIFKAIAKGIEQVNADFVDLSYTEAKLPSLYATDNIWMPYVHQTPRTVIDTTNGFIIYTRNSNRQLLRVPTAAMQKINTNATDSNNPYASLITNLKTSKWSRSKELYQIEQPLRDVKNNIDYNISSFLVFNPDAVNEVNPASPISFLNDSLNKIYANQQMIGKFSVAENVLQADVWVDPNELYNGYDSTEKISLSTQYKKMGLVANKQIKGIFKNSPFTILINYDAAIKTVLVDQQVALIAYGDSLPTHMVIVQNNLSEEFLNFVLLFAYSELFQMPKAETIVSVSGISPIPNSIEE
jgi:hypothetical protein